MYRARQAPAERPSFGECMNHIYLSIYLSLSLSMYIYIYVYTPIHTRICMCIDMCIYLYVSLSLYIYIYIHIFMYIYIYIYIYMYIYSLIYTYTYSYFCDARHCPAPPAASLKLCSGAFRFQNSLRVPVCNKNTHTFDSMRFASNASLLTVLCK